MATNQDTTPIPLSPEDRRAMRRVRDRAKYAANPEPFRGRGRRARAAHREARNAYNRAYREAHRDELKAQQYLYREQTREQRQVANRTYRRTQAEAIRIQRKAYRAAHRAELSVRNKQYRAEHGEALKHQKKTAYQGNRATILARNSAYAKAHLDTLRAQKAAWRAAKGDILRRHKREYARAYYAAHPEIRAAKDRRRRAIKAGALIRDLTPAQWHAIKEHYGHRCVYCHRKMTQLTQDHLTPLSKGGAHTLSNVVPACRSCNSRKQAGPPKVPVQPLLLVGDSREHCDRE